MNESYTISSSHYLLSLVHEASLTWAKFQLNFFLCTPCFTLCLHNGQFTNKKQDEYKIQLYSIQCRPEVQKKINNKKYRGENSVQFLIYLLNVVFWLLLMPIYRLIYLAAFPNLESTKRLMYTNKLALCIEKCVCRNIKWILNADNSSRSGLEHISSGK